MHSEDRTPIVIAKGRDRSRAAGTDRDVVMLVAFEGWNDAGEAASSAVNDLVELWSAEQIAEISPDDYYDYQFTRPTVTRTPAGGNALQWPGTRIYRAAVPGHELDVVFVVGVEPSFRWQQFVDEILSHAKDAGAVLLVGALIADVPHTRPIPVSMSTEDSELREALDLDRNSYEGPTGVLGVLGHLALAAGLPTVSLWAAIPGYVAQAPSPKAQLALTGRIEEVLGVSIPQGTLTDDAKAWERGVNELADDDEDISRYVRQLEEVQDTAELPEASGDAIAKEFERYLRRKNPPDGHKGPR
ncbi:PAC2 family protein [Saxibacter everestensis]|uniref:PAC2 family protein n=1 Tax=Saxibacter everestensis TaxID=2909229 RepID=A0ABY8QXF4_9MICO|nr:PAC2 family protein [Brevibacteriaceae bacterium ZFBP1038]